MSQAPPAGATALKRNIANLVSQNLSCPLLAQPIRMTLCVSHNLCGWRFISLEQVIPAAAQAEEWRPHPYEHEGVGRKESLKGELPEQKQHAERKE